MAKAGTNAGMDWCRTRLAIKPGIQARSLTIVHLPGHAQGYPISITRQLSHQLGPLLLVWSVWRREPSNSPKWQQYLPSGQSSCITLGCIRSAARSPVIRLALLQDGPMPTKRVPTAFFGHFMRQPIIDSVSRSTALLPGVP